MKKLLNKISQSSADETCRVHSQAGDINFVIATCHPPISGKIATTLTAIFIWLLLCSTQSTARTLELVTLQYPPYIYREDGDIKGIAVQIIRESFRRMQQPIKITLLPWSRAIMRIRNGSADAIFTAYKNPDRETFADYSKAIVMPQIVSLFVLKDSSITWNGNFQFLTQYTIGVVRKVSYGKLFDQAVTDHTLGKIQYAGTGEQNMEKLLKGRFDVLVSNKYGALDILKKMGKSNQVKELSPEIQSVPSYIAFSKKRNLSAIRDQFDSVFAAMKKDGTYEQIIQSYFFTRPLTPAN
ncbi:MAG: transporter substrate-binding domain-containing protein [Pseudomonadales bacterium]|nr:transporter substrate-binding domain-containing protein [Pseudomonadales bacterium]NRA16266.1 transporter substrate-binding domain-containing protein [Oceanospirillaceae bacterium]